jgi:hypothetical protein
MPEPSERVLDVRARRAARRVGLFAKKSRRHVITADPLLKNKIVFKNTRAGKEKARDRSQRHRAKTKHRGEE